MAATRKLQGKFIYFFGNLCFFFTNIICTYTHNTERFRANMKHNKCLMHYSNNKQMSSSDKTISSANQIATKKSLLPYINYVLDNFVNEIYAHLGIVHVKYFSGNFYLSTLLSHAILCILFFIIIIS